MRFGVFVSVLLHLVATGLAMFSLPESWRSRVTPEPVIPIDIISEAELARLTSVPAAQRQPAPVETPSPRPAPQPREEPPRPAPQPRPEPPPPEVRPEPAPQPQPEPRPEPPAPQARPEPAPQPPRPQPRPQPQRQDELDLDRLAAVVDRSRADQPQPQGAPSEAPQADRTRAQVGAGDRLTASDRAKMQAAIQRCWNISALAGAPGADRLIVVVEFELNRDGTLAGQPRVANAMQINMSGNQFWRVAQQTALRAVTACQPYNFFPAERFDDWRAWELTFNPAEMAGY
jgi:outer membrane biosynthesis protein TonB